MNHQGMSKVIFVMERAGMQFWKLSEERKSEQCSGTLFFHGISFTRFGVPCHPTAILSN
jgi:hypothetical protein